MSERDGREWAFPIQLPVPVEETLMAAVTLTIDAEGNVKLHWQPFEGPEDRKLAWTPKEWQQLLTAWPLLPEAIALSQLQTTEDPAEPPAPGGTLT